MVEQGCLFWIFSKQIPGQPAELSFLTATLPPSQVGEGRWRKEGKHQLET